MRPYDLFGALLFAGLGAGCGHDHDNEKEWTKAELDELEEKWGFQVNTISFMFREKECVE